MGNAGAATTTPPGSTGGSAPPNLAGLLGSNMVQDYTQQILQNPRQMEQMLSTPYMQSMLQMMGNNPEMARMMVDSNPQLAANPELREQIVRTMPNMLQQVFFANAEFFIKKLV
jgi:ubiquilin